DLEFGIETAAPPDLDRLSEAPRISRLAEQTMIRTLAMLLHPLQHLARAVDRHALLVSGDEQADGAVDVPTPRLGIVERGCGEAGDRPLHVRCASAVEAAAGEPRGKTAQ